MKTLLLPAPESTRLVLLFAGWGVDASLFEGLCLSGYRIMVVWDYRDDSFPEEALGGYEEICVLAWSYGVFMASRFLESYRNLPLTARVAVGGTPCPVDPLYGIDPKIFDATLSAMSEGAMAKFMRRMCGGAAALSVLGDRLPRRDASGAREELSRIGALASETRRESVAWDYAFITANDLIFPADSQRRYWEGKAAVVELDSHHLPDFSALLGRAFIRKAGVAEAFSRSIDTYDDNAPVQRSVASALADAIAAAGPLSGRVVEIGSGSGFLTRRIFADNPGITSLTLMDVTPLPDGLPGEHLRCDAETAIASLPAESVDAIVAASAAQWFNSLRAFLERAAAALRPGGMIALAVYGAGTFAEIPGLVSPSRLFDREMLGLWTPDGLTCESYSETVVTLCFDSPRELLRHFRLTGTAPSSDTGAARAIIRCGTTTLSYAPIFVVLRKQQ